MVCAFLRTPDFQGRMESIDSFFLDYPHFVHIIEILVIVSKGRNLGFLKSTPTQAHWVGCLLQPCGAVGKTVNLLSARQLLPQVQSPNSFPIISFLIFKLEFTRNAPSE